MKTPLCIALLSAGLFSAQTMFAQSSCGAVDVNCMAKHLSLSGDQTQKIASLVKEYESRCAALPDEKSSADAVVGLMKEREAAISEVLDKEQNSRLAEAMKACSSSGKPAEPSPAAK